VECYHGTIFRLDGSTDGPDAPVPWNGWHFARQVLPRGPQGVMVGMAGNIYFIPHPGAMINNAKQAGEADLMCI
jgi:hypothetical protein